MRIIAGSAGGIPLKTPGVMTRPTTDRARESLFASLGDLLVGARVLDLYAGSGSLGIEALSRGAESALFIEQDRKACEVIQANLDKARLKGGLVRCSQVTRFLSKSARGIGGYDLIFSDPPYAKNEEAEEELLSLITDEHLPDLLGDKGIWVLETLSSSDLPEVIKQNWELRDERRYGETRISFLAKRLSKEC